MIIPFNADMTARLQAIQSGKIEATFLPAFAGQPDRVQIKAGDRTFALSLDMARATAAQLRLGGYAQTAEALTSAIRKGQPNPLETSPEVASLAAKGLAGGDLTDEQDRKVYASALAQARKS